METRYAPADKASNSEIKSQSDQLLSNKLINQVLNAVPEAVMILNQERQIIFVNEATLNTIGMGNSEIVSGQRPGDAFQCSHSTLTEGGCGTTEFCKYCGAVNAILSSQQGKTVINECRITQSPSGTALDLKVKAAPFDFEGKEYTVFSILDISFEKSKQALERVFFHDILNTAGGLSGYSELLQDANPEELDEYKEIILELSNRVVEEIKSQRQLIAAENGDLELDNQEVNSLELLKAVAEGYRKHPVAETKSIIIDENSESKIFKTDKILLSRVLGNLVKNALEATDKNSSVKVGCQQKDDQIQFYIHNPNVMPEEVQMQVFQRSFSTKGVGRGIGTYSIKLFTEKYLKGSVWFTSTETDGTTFIAGYPIFKN
jgi:K+-sensing histidine kinase KdpD